MRVDGNILLRVCICVYTHRHTYTCAYIYVVCEQIFIFVCYSDFGSSPGDDVHDVASEGHIREILKTLYIHVYIKNAIQGAIAISVKPRQRSLTR